MFDHLDGVIRAFAKKTTASKEDLFSAVKLDWRKLSSYYAEVTPTTCMLLISAHILDPFRNLRSCRKWDMGMDINPDDKTSYTTQHKQASLMCEETVYGAKLRRVSVNMHERVPSSTLIPSAMASGSCESSFDPYDLSINDEGYLTPNNVAETTPGQSDHAALLSTAAWLHLYSPPEAPKNRGQINPNINDYHSDQREISSTFWLQHLADWLCQQEETHTRYANLS